MRHYYIFVRVLIILRHYAHDISKVLDNFIFGFLIDLADMRCSYPNIIGMNVTMRVSKIFRFNGLVQSVIFDSVVTRILWNSFDSMEFSVATTNVLHSIGYLNQNQLHTCNIDYVKRIICLMSCGIVISCTLWNVAYEAKAFVDKIKPLMALFFAYSSLVTYSVMLLQRRSTFDVLGKLQDKVNERMLFHLIQCSYLILCPVNNV